MAKQPREYLRWDLLDRPDDPVPWQTSDVRTLSRFYERLSDAAEQAAADMRRLEGNSLGEGDTVAALKELVNELPKHLDKAQEAYEKGYRALDKWEISLGTARQDSASIAHQAASAYTALEDTDAWKKRVDGEDPERDAFITRLTSVLNDMDEAARECADALEEAKQGSPRKLWGWLDKIVTWVEENPLLYAVAMVVAGLAAIFIPGLGIALAAAVLAISTSSLVKEGKFGLNMETVVTLGMDALSLIPGGTLLKGGRAVTGMARQAATRTPGRLRGGVSRAASSVRSGASRAVPARVSRAAGTTAGRVSQAANTTGGKIATTIAKDSAASMASSVTVQVAGEGRSLSDINWTSEALTAVGTSAAGSTAGVLKDNGTLPTFFGGGADNGGSGGGGTDSTPDPGGSGPDVDGPPDSGASSDNGTNSGGRGGSGESSTATTGDGTGTRGSVDGGGPEGGTAAGPSPADPATGAATNTSSGGAENATSSADAAASTDSGGFAGADGGSSGNTSPSGTGEDSGSGRTGGPSVSGAGADGATGPGASAVGAATMSSGDASGAGEATGSAGSGDAGTGATPTGSGDVSGTGDTAGAPNAGSADGVVGGSGDGRTSADPAPDSDASNPTNQGGSRDSASESGDGAGGRDSGEGRSGRDAGGEPREEFAPVTRSGGGTNTPQPPDRSRTRVGEPDDVDVSSGNRDGQALDASARPGARSDGSASSTHGGTEPNPAPRTTGQDPSESPTPSADRAQSEPGSQSPRRSAEESAPARGGQEPIRPEQRSPGQTSSEAAPRQRGEDTQPPDSPRADSGASAQDGSTVTHTRTTGRGEFTTTRGPDGEQNTSYRYPAASEGGSDLTLNVTRDGADVNGTGVRSTGRGFEVSSTDGSSVRSQRDGAIRTGDLAVTGPGGRGRASYRDGELTVSTRDGDVSVSRDANGNEVRTEDGLTVRQDADGLRVSHTGDGPVDQRMDGDGPDVTRAAADSTGRPPRSQVTDPTTGRNAEVGVDGYRVDVPGGSSHGFDRADGTVRVESGDARAEVRPDSAHLSHADHGVDFALRQDGTGRVRGGPSSAEIRADGGIDLRASVFSQSNDATLRQEADTRGGTRPVFRAGNVTAEPGQVSFDHGARVEVVDHQGTRAIRVVDGGRQRTYNMDGTPVRGETYPSLPLSPGADSPFMVISSPDGSTLTRVTIEPGRGGGGPGSAPAMRVESPYGWSVRTSGDADVSMAAPGGRENSLEVTRRGDGSVAVSTRDGSHRADNGGGRLSVSGPGQLRGDTDGDRVRVSDGEASTTARTDESSVIPGERVAETRSDREPRRSFGESSQHENSVSTSEGTSVWARGNEVNTTMAPGREPGTVGSGDRTVDITPDGLSARGTGRDSGTWEVSTGPAGTSGRNGAQSIEVTADPGRGGVRSPVHTGDGGIQWRNPRNSPEQIRFETGGDVAGSRTASGRTEVTDASNGTTVRDARGGARVDPGGGGPELRVTENHVRVSAPDGTQHRVDVPGPSADGGTASSGRDGSGTTSDGEGRRGSDRPERPGRDPVTDMPNTRRAAVEAIPFELFKNILNVVAGTGFDFARHFAAEATGLDWLSDGIAFGPDGTPNPSYVVQSFMQLGTAIPKAAAEGRYAGADGLPGLPLELGHQAMRNNLRDEYLDEFHEDFREGEKVEDQLDALNKLLTEENLKEYEATRDTEHSNPGAVEEQERADRFLAEAQAQRKVLEARLAKLYDVSLEDVEKMRDQG
ncbi:hypothetical protein [Nocardiopsis sp. SBT366]|uniref:hypothetical protein n=1 Tax=Nocardiopsis sp. SBT366 TaxID=1580529 RepID=UPI00066C9F19|nr:hypothetical protein [Nocardiopsis sp. SBT366]